MYKICFIAPRNPLSFWSIQKTIKATGAKTTFPNIAIATLISLIPEDLPVTYSICDENIQTIPKNVKYDLVAITGYTIHAKRIKKLYDYFHKQGIKVALGGAFATLNKEEARQYCDFHFIGEAENTWPRFLRDCIKGTPQNTYQENNLINMETSPVPVWDKMKIRSYYSFPVQISRGCPNHCDFCDVVRIYGHKFRHKTINQVLREIENLYRMGITRIFICDDNFYINRSFLLDLLKEIRVFCQKHETKFRLTIQATIRIGEDEEILGLLSDIGCNNIFIGLESINMKSLAEVNKMHVTVKDPSRAFKNISKYGILPVPMLIAGFDNDTEKTFMDIAAFIGKNNLPLVAVSLLNAPRDTVLYKRLSAENRIKKEFAGSWFFSTNIVPKNMTELELKQNQINLYQNLFHPQAFEKRLLGWLDEIDIKSMNSRMKINRKKSGKLKYAGVLLKVFLFVLFELPRNVRKVFIRVLRQISKKESRLIKPALTNLIQYTHYFDFSYNKKWRT